MLNFNHPCPRCGQQLGDFYSKRCRRCYAKDRIGKERFPFLERFFKYVKKTDTCWLWTGHTDSGGYGTIKRFGKMKKAHRISFSIHFGDIKDGLDICHHCDNPRCVNPTHLFAGTAKDNFQDAIKKNRINPQRGVDHFRYKLTPMKRKEMRSRYLKGNITQSRLAKENGISQQLVSLIVSSPNLH